MCLSDILQTSHTPNCGDEPSAYIIYPRKLSAMNGIWPGGDSFVILQPHFISHLFMRGTVRKISLLMTVVFRNLRLRKHSFHPHPQRKRPDCHPLPPLSSRTGPSSFGQRLPVHRGRQCGDILNVASRRDELRRFRTPIYGTDRPAVREKLRCI